MYQTPDLQYQELRDCCRYHWRSYIRRAKDHSARRMTGVDPLVVAVEKERWYPGTWEIAGLLD
jgi:hypothetical protein